MLSLRHLHGHHPITKKDRNCFTAYSQTRDSKHWKSSVYKRQITYHHRFMDDIFDFGKRTIPALVFKNPTHWVTNKGLVHGDPIKFVSRTKHSCGKCCQPELFRIETHWLEVNSYTTSLWLKTAISFEGERYIFIWVTHLSISWPETQVIQFHT